ncbi:hypothetical protein MOKP101_40600 [Mycobacterium avium subsp. hominissuis]|jgi:ferredoxin|uniref:Ferredoxin n=1 Tax=Mycobacterium intracellulare TaxID=1767 RepID=A0A7R7MTU0_MYCIT|nr:hypothetical protein MINTM018_13420 [Mycobacterium intracellulare]
MRASGARRVRTIDDDVVEILFPEPAPEGESTVTDAVIACPKQALRLLAD